MIATGGENVNVRRISVPHSQTQTQSHTQYALNDKIAQRRAQDSAAYSRVASQMPPHVFVIDWDGTIAGNVDYQSQYFNVLSVLKRHRIKPNVTNIIPHAFSPKAKLIRPGFASWMKAMKELYGEVYFFVYTASEKRWAHQEIAWVEKLHDIKFDRPIFTRQDCIVDGSGATRKSLAKVFPRMMTSVNKRRPLTPEQRQAVLKNHTMIIDNNAVYLDHTDKLLLCPDYGYNVFENLLHVIPKESRSNPAVQQLILSLANSGYLCPTMNKYSTTHTPPTDDEVDGMKELAHQYKWLAIKCKTMCRSNEPYMKDQFWKTLKKLLVSNKLSVYTPSIIKQLQEACWGRVETRI